MTNLLLCKKLDFNDVFSYEIEQNKVKVVLKTTPKKNVEVGKLVEKFGVLVKLYEDDCFSLREKDFSLDIILSKLKLPFDERLKTLLYKIAEVFVQKYALNLFFQGCNFSERDLLSFLEEVDEETNLAQSINLHFEGVHSRKEKHPFRSVLAGNQIFSKFFSVRFKNYHPLSLQIRNIKWHVSSQLNTVNLGSELSDEKFLLRFVRSLTLQTLSVKTLDLNMKNLSNRSQCYLLSSISKPTAVDKLKLTNLIGCEKGVLKNIDKLVRNKLFGLDLSFDVESL
eukprot:snap_masked-scaffold_10-processed-gene-11.26-mRNA-1 protein AED:1.00 eAED:1.00 QI:0/-1/0/0/-1/1/1/0/281